MKSERRHELEHNELADWTVNILESIKPYTNVIVGGTIAVVILAVALALWTKQADLKADTAWNLYYSGLNSSDPALLQDVVELYPSSTAAQWAAVGQGDIHLKAGCNGLFVDKANAKQELKLAIECYKGLKDSGNPLLDERAKFGLARAYEAQGDLEEAKAAYENQLKRWKDGPYAEMARRQLANLENPQTLTFYDRFAKYEPKPDLSAEEKPSKVVPSFDSVDLPAPSDQPAEATPAEVAPAGETKETP